MNLSKDNTTTACCTLTTDWIEYMLDSRLRECLGQITPLKLDVLSIVHRDWIHESFLKL